MNTNSNQLSLLLRLAQVVTRRSAKIFMYHKFSCLDLENKDNSAALFEAQLQYIVSGGFRIATNPVDAIQKGGVCLTVDDGYRDFYEIAFPLLKKYNVPATLYVTSGFINEELWMWYDQVEYLFDHNSKQSFELSHVAWPQTKYQCSTSTKYQITEYLKQVDNHLKIELLADLANALEVELPLSAPEGYEACSWDMLQEMDGDLVTIGAHSHTHPILTQIEPAYLDFELRHSKALLEEKLGRRVDDFCYPNGTWLDYSDLVISTLQNVGYRYAVTAFTDGYQPRDLFHIRRLGGVHSMYDFKKHIHGVEYLSQKVRGWQSGRFKPRMPQ